DRDPDHPEALFHLGNLERERGQYDVAIGHYRQALVRAPGHAGVLNNLGLAYEARGDLAQAEHCYRQVLAGQPHHPDALANLARLEFASERYAAAAARYDRLFAIRRDLPVEVWVRRGIAQDRVHDAAGAEASFAEAARLAPDDLQIHVNLLTHQMSLARYAAAEPTILRTLELDPGNPYALSMLVHARQQRAIWRGLEALFAEVNSALARPPHGDGRYTVNPFPLLAMPSGPRAQLVAAQRWASTIAPTPPASPPATRRGAAERLRIGFVSADLREHPMAHLHMEHWERIDHDRIETFGYGVRATDRGAIGERIARAFEHFADVSRALPAELDRRIRADRIAILFDLNGYTADGASHLFALRPAPIQVNSIGFPGTLGAPWYDYILVDRFGAPESMQPFYSERLWHMPHASYPSDTKRAPQGPPPSRAECGLPERGFVFCCLNKSFKILPPVFAIWMRLLQAVPDSVLWLIDSDAESSANLRREAGAAGVDPARLVFAPKVPQERHLARHAAADLFVDTFPYGAHTTTNDALLVGLPVLTCAGETLVTRLAGSQLTAIGLPELVTHDFADYEALALTLAREPAALAELRGRLAANRQTSPLFDMVRYTRDFEDGLEAIWKDYAARMSSA
ncbi:MAG TPA: tetratricopeptide repeat protein, partial [Casimicrobiaceae bacterium]|nr:tetratricopeptide repeat protein [Casimicrobiaceae bacterium]